MLGKRILAIALAAIAAVTIHAQDLDDAVVYTVRVPTATGMSDAQLKALALTRGTIELLRFFEDQPLERLIIRLGDEGLGCPGFTSLNRTAAEEAIAKGAKRAKTAKGDLVHYEEGGATADWLLPVAVGKDPFTATLTLDGKPVYTETRQEQVVGKSGEPEVRPIFVRLDYEDDETIAQFYDWDALPPGDWLDPYEGVGSVPGTVSKASLNDPAKFAQSNGTNFHSKHGFTFDWDSGYWPGGGTSPGSFPLQVRLQVGAGWGRGADFQGTLNIDEYEGTMSLGPVSGQWWVDYGAELNLVAALSIPMIPPITIDIDDIIASQLGIPSFNMRWQQNAAINSWLLGDAGSLINKELVRKQLFNFDIVDAILASAGVSLPSWIPLSAGVKLDGSIEARGTLHGNHLKLSDGTTFTPADHGPQRISIMGPTYTATANFDAQVDLEVALHAFPQLYAEIIFTRFDLPLGDLVLPIPVGYLDMNFDPCTVQIDGIDYDIGEIEAENPEGEGTIEGQPEGEGEIFEGEVVIEGEGTVEGETEGEGEIIVEEPLEKLACTSLEAANKSVAMADMDRTVSTINVADRGYVDNVVVWLDLYHLRMADVAVSLISPQGTRIDLFSLIGGDGANMRDTTFSDAAFVPIRSGTPPYGGQYEPFDALAAFQGENAQGDWQLVVNDVKLYNRGVLLDWNLSINTCDEEGEPSGEGEGEGETEGQPEGQNEGEVTVDPSIHTLDYNPADGKISLNELLRAIQLYNSGWFSCDPAGEDGFTIGTGGGFTCEPHALDYNPVNWRISLGEILRAVQLFNAGGYHLQAGTEDGFAPGAE